MTFFYALPRINQNTYFFSRKYRTAIAKYIPIREELVGIKGYNSHKRGLHVSFKCWTSEYESAKHCAHQMRGKKIVLYFFFFYLGGAVLMRAATKGGYRHGSMRDNERGGSGDSLKSTRLEMSQQIRASLSLPLPPVPFHLSD